MAVSDVPEIEVIAPLEEPASVRLRAIAATAPPEGLTGRALADASGLRGIGLMAFALGVALLIPVAWVLPQLIGVVLIFLGWRAARGQQALWLPVMWRDRLIPPSRLDRWAGFAERRLKPIEQAIRPRLGDFTALGEGVAGWALLIAGLSVLAPIPHLIPALGLIALGAGLIQKDGAAHVIGLALIVGWAAFLITMGVGLGLGADFAEGWAATDAPFLKAFAPPD